MLIAEINEAIQFLIVSKSDHALTSPVFDIPIISLDSIQRESDNVDHRPAIVFDCLIIIPLNCPPSAVSDSIAFFTDSKLIFQFSIIPRISVFATHIVFASASISGTHAFVNCISS